MLHPNAYAGHMKAAAAVNLLHAPGRLKHTSLNLHFDQQQYSSIHCTVRVLAKARGCKKSAALRHPSSERGPCTSVLFRAQGSFLHSSRPPGLKIRRQAPCSVRKANACPPPLEFECACDELLVTAPQNLGSCEQVRKLHMLVLARPCGNTGSLWE